MKRSDTSRPARTNMLGVRVPAELKAQIEAAAAADQRSVSQWLAMAAEAALKARQRPIEERETNDGQ